MWMYHNRRKHLHKTLTNLRKLIDFCCSEDDFTLAGKTFRRLFIPWKWIEFSGWVLTLFFFSSSSEEEGFQLWNSDIVTLCCQLILTPGLSERENAWRVKASVCLQPLFLQWTLQGSFFTRCIHTAKKCCRHDGAKWKWERMWTRKYTLGM